MDTSRLKRFAPECRTELMKQVEVKLDYVLTAKTPDLAAQETLLNDLRRVLEHEGRDALIERVAYTWFNRFAAFRYLDAHGWHPFRVRVITAPSEGDVLPELLQQVRKGVVPEELKEFVSASRINDLLDGNLPSPNPQAEVQRLLVIGVSQYYAELLPNLFDKIDAFTELLLPDDLVTEHSVVHGFVSEIADEDCAEVELLGWLYQFYISKKKDEVMARKKAVPSEDIPAVTQLFTPHWIVRYLVENSLGRLWLRSRPDSRLREHMPYYVEDPAPSDKASAKAEGQEPADSLTVETPEEIQLLDPACGSGHMLTYSFDLLAKIYEEEGYTPSEIPALILENNLYGLEICPRAAQLAQFALVCKAREQSRSAFRHPVQPQVMRLRDVVIEPEEVVAWMKASGVKLSQDELSQIHQFRENTETFGSLIQPVLDKGKLTALREKVGEQTPASDLLVQSTHRKLRLVLDQAEMLSQRYHVVVANPPYMGSGAMDATLLKFVKSKFPESRIDLMACFMEQCQFLAGGARFVGMINQHSWMFLRSYTGLREKLLRNARFETMLHLGPRTFPEISGEIVQSVAFVLSGPTRRRPTPFQRLVKFSTSEEKELYRDNSDYRFVLCQEEFKKLPDSMFGYWLGESSRSAFSDPRLGDSIPARRGLQTGDAPRFIREWYEVEQSATHWGKEERDKCIESGARWYRFNNGGDYCRWYGNLEYVVNWRCNGHDIKATGKAIIPSEHLYFLPAITWSRLSGGRTAFRLMDSGIIPGDTGPCAFPKSNQDAVLSYLNSVVSKHFLSFLVPTMTFLTGDIENMPFCPRRLTDRREQMDFVVRGALGLSRLNWDNFETSWDFRDVPLLRHGNWELDSDQPGGPWRGDSLAESWQNYANYCNAAIQRMQELETENNRLWIDAYGLQDELTPEVPEDEITLARADARDDMAAFVSYAVGCMMGRFSLDQPGLILANAGDTVEDYLEKVGKSADELTFAPDDDAIIPITEDEWFPDDAASRVRDFLRATFGPETLEQNLTFLEDSLGKPLRRYFTANT
ncbi:MAG: BREX-1 system adenine-specific DNA-methyltransferase PglX, partial [Verrucomicrobiales bacterium]|nr:BREX-1 system adenine-specific DNA-methyltransferase PglX [Verrucomicrobiales bacterium]